MNHRIAGVVALIMAASCIRLSQASETLFEWDWVSSATVLEARASDLLMPAEQSSVSYLDMLLDVQIKRGRWTGLFVIMGNRVMTSDPDASFDGEAVVRELFWESEATVFSKPVDLMLGKVRLDWGVGYGYRPLDVFKSYQRNPVGIQVDEGVGTALASYYDASGEWSLVATDSSWSQQSGNELEHRSEQQGIGVRRYHFEDDTEWQGIAYFDNVRQGLVGGSFVRVLNPVWAVHASAVYQNRYPGYQQPEHWSPVIGETFSNGVQSLVGVNWANDSGHNIVAEYWYDSRSWSKQQWQTAFDRAVSLSAHPATQPLAWSYGQGLNHTNLVQHNVMLHWSLDSVAWQHWDWSRDVRWLDNLTPTLDVLYSPSDSGVIATQWLDYRVYDSGTASLDIGVAARFFSGRNDSVFANLSDQRQWVVNVKGKF